MTVRSELLETIDVEPLLRSMIRIRRFEERCVELYSAGAIRGFMHLGIGEEAVAAGVISELHADDAVVSTYREHGHALARGLPMASVYAEMFGKQEGCSGGRGGSMHLFDASRRFYGGNAIVASALPIAVGLALAARLREQPTVTVCLFGEGAVAEGEFHESMNLAALWKLPVLFVCENNLYAMGTALARSESQTNLAFKASAYGMPACSVDGMDAIKVRATAVSAVAAIRAGGGPMFLEAKTYRFRAHSMYDPERYRTKQEVTEWKERDPIALLQKQALEEGVINTGDIDRYERDAAAEIEVAVAQAQAGTLEPVSRLQKYVTSATQTLNATSVDAASGTTSYRESFRSALREALQRDDRVFMMGEDIGAYGGCFAVSLGLVEEFGEARIRDTPLSESAFVGAGIGAAIGGMRPIVEIMTVNFSLLALDQILNNAATLLHMSNGQVNVPLVIRMTTGAGRQLAAQHSHSLEGWYAHIPGLRVLVPATIEDARSMLWSALQDPDPVLIFEHGGLYNVTCDLDATRVVADIDHAAVRRVGEHVSVFAYGGTLSTALRAAEELATSGISAEVVDLRTLRPLDTATIVASVAHTHHAVIVDEGWRSGSISAEISARIMEEAFFELDAPVIRVCSAEVPIPYAKQLEEAALPQVSDVVAAVHAVLAHE